MRFCDICNRYLFVYLPLFSLHFDNLNLKAALKIIYIYKRCEDSSKLNLQIKAKKKPKKRERDMVLVFKINSKFKDSYPAVFTL